MKPDFESRKHRQRRDRWRLRLWLAEAMARCVRHVVSSVLAVVLMTSLAVPIVRHLLFDGYPPAVRTSATHPLTDTSMRTAHDRGAFASEKSGSA